MKSIVLFFFVIGIVFITIGYQKMVLTNTKTKNIIEYRFIPQSLYEEQMGPVNLEHTFHDMFKRENVFLSSIG